jgi:hypothetical protein
MTSVEKKTCVQRPTLACGVDIGTQNLAISFVGVGVSEGCVISYKGTLNEVRRFEEDQETAVLKFGTKSKRPSTNDICEVYVSILESIPELDYTVSTVIEMQLAFNRSEMSRLDGIAYGFLKGRFPGMKISINAATIRRKFISDRVSEDEESVVVVPRGYPATKHQSMVFVCTKMSSFYRYITQNEDIDKIDDICDSLVYASIAADHHLKAQSSARSMRK